MPDAAEQVEQQGGGGAPPIDPALREHVEARQRARRHAEETGEGAEPRSGAELLKAAASPNARLSDEEIHDALDTFFEVQDDPDAKIEPKTLRLNVGREDTPKWVRWVIAPVDDAVIAKFRKQSTKGTRAQRLRGEAETDELLVARKMVVAGTVEPDIGALASRLKLADPTDALLAYFRKFGKTGLIVQLSGQILGLSGYDEDDVAEVDAAGG